MSKKTYVFVPVPKSKIPPFPNHIIRLGTGKKPPVLFSSKKGRGFL
jgi:hypothetical protein